MIRKNILLDICNGSNSELISKKFRRTYNHSNIHKSLISIEWCKMKFNHIFNLFFVNPGPHASKKTFMRYALKSKRNFNDSFLCFPFISLLQNCPYRKSFLSNFTRFLITIISCDDLWLLLQKLLLWYFKYPCMKSTISTRVFFFHWHQIAIEFLYQEVCLSIWILFLFDTRN